jgi:hypothetical protein
MADLRTVDVKLYDFFALPGVGKMGPSTRIRSAAK